MKTKIKYIKKNLHKGYYAVRIKKGLFWKTIRTDTVFANIEKFIETLAQINEFNNKSKSLNKVVYEGWAARNVYKNTGIGYSLNFFNSTIHKRKRDDLVEIAWVDINDNPIPIIEIKGETLFGKKCLEPMKLRITIEQIEE